jgi:hypothetical protein
MFSIQRSWCIARSSAFISRVLVFCLPLGAVAARADALKIENVAAAPRDANTAAVTFDIAWSNSWRLGSFHDAVWVFFKIKADDKADWQPVKLAADKPVNPTGYGLEKDGTPLEFVVPDGADGYVGMFVRRATTGRGPVAARRVTAVWDLAAGPGQKSDVRKVQVQACGIEMAYVAAGPYYLGSSGPERDRFYMMPADDPARPSTRRQLYGNVVSADEGVQYPLSSADAVPTGRRKGQLWAAGMTPEDGGAIPAAFPNGYAAFYCAKTPYITQGQYTGFLNTLTASQAKARYHAGIHGRVIRRAGETPSAAFSAANPHAKSSGLSWTDGAAYAAWAGLRPMTELEYEKAIRGPLASGPNDASLSFWGLADVNYGGTYERPVSAGSAAGRAFAGTHGRGTPAPPADWPRDASGIVYRGGFGPRGSDEHLLTAGRRDAIDVFADRCDHPYACWRVARSAPADDTAAGGPVGVRRFQPKVPRLDRPFRVNSPPGDLGSPLAELSDLADVFPVDKRFVSLDGRPLWQGPHDMGAKVYLVSDGEAIGLMAEVTDDRHVNAERAGTLCNGDAIQMGLVNAKGVQWNIALALTASGVALHQFDGPDDVLAKTADCCVTRDDKARVTRYGLRLPLAALGLEPGAEFGFNLLFVDDDDKGQCYWLQLAPGLARGPARGSNTALYPRFLLQK